MPAAQSARCQPSSAAARTCSVARMALTSSAAHRAASPHAAPASAPVPDAGLGVQSGTKKMLGHALCNVVTRVITGAMWRAEVCSVPCRLGGYVRGWTHVSATCRFAL